MWTKAAEACCCAHLLRRSDVLRIKSYMWSDHSHTCIYSKGRGQLSLRAQSPEVLAVLSWQLSLISFSRDFFPHVTWPLRPRRGGAGSCVLWTELVLRFKHMVRIRKQTEAPLWPTSNKHLEYSNYLSTGSNANSLQITSDNHDTLTLVDFVLRTRNVNKIARGKIDILSFLVNWWNHEHNNLKNT